MYAQNAEVSVLETRIDLFHEQDEEQYPILFRPEAPTTAHSHPDSAQLRVQKPRAAFSGTTTTSPRTHQVEVAFRVPNQARIWAYVALGFPARPFVSPRDEAGEPHTRTDLDLGRGAGAVRERPWVAHIDQAPAVHFGAVPVRIT